MPEETNDIDQFEREFLTAIDRPAQEEIEGLELISEIPSAGRLFQCRKADRQGEDGNVYNSVRDVYECQYCRTVVRGLLEDKFQDGRLIRDPFLRECKHRKNLLVWLVHLFFWWMWNVWKTASARSGQPRWICGRRVCMTCYRITDSRKGYCPDHAKSVLVPSPVNPSQKVFKNMGVREYKWHLVGRFFRVIGRGIAGLVRWGARRDA